MIRNPSRPATPITAVGWNCISSRSASAAPAAPASSRPIPCEPGGLVVRDQSAAAPPVARITARLATTGPAVADQPAAAALVPPEGPCPRALEHRDPRLGGSQRRELPDDPPARRTAAGMDDPADRVPSLEPQRQMRRSGRRRSGRPGPAGRGRSRAPPAPEPRPPSGARGRARRPRCPSGEARSCHPPPAPRPGPPGPSSWPSVPGGWPRSGRPRRPGAPRREPHRGRLRPRPRRPRRPRVRSPRGGRASREPYLPRTGRGGLTPPRPGYLSCGAFGGLCSGCS